MRSSRPGRIGGGARGSQTNAQLNLMSKDLARSSESYENERLAMAAAPIVLCAKGFDAVRILRPRGMKIAEATRADGDSVIFWLKQAWSTTPVYSAVQFGMLPASPPPKSLSDAAFVEFVADRINAVGGNERSRFRHHQRKQHAEQEARNRR